MRRIDDDSVANDGKCEAHVYQLCKKRRIYSHKSKYKTVISGLHAKAEKTLQACVYCKGINKLVLCKYLYNRTNLLLLNQKIANDIICAQLCIIMPNQRLYQPSLYIYKVCKNLTLRRPNSYYQLQNLYARSFFTTVYMPY